MGPQHNLLRGVALYVNKCSTSNLVKIANAAKETVWVEKEKNRFLDIFIEVPTTIRVITHYYLRQFMQHHNLTKITYY